MTKVFIPAPKKIFELLQDWEPIIDKNEKNADLLKDWFDLKLNSWKSSDLEKWYAVKDTKITFLAGTRISVEKYTFTKARLKPHVMLRLRDTQTNKWARATRRFFVTVEDFQNIDCRMV